jgi:hypothetical protein
MEGMVSRTEGKIAEKSPDEHDISEMEYRIFNLITLSRPLEMKYHPTDRRPTVRSAIPAAAIKEDP